MMISKFKTFGIVVFINMLVFLILGCTQLFGDTPGRKGITEITLTPIDLFKGDRAKFRHFLGSMSGAFKLRYDGNKPNVKLDIDIWQNGKKVASSGSIGDLFFSSDESREVEVIISIDTISIEGYDEFITIKIGTTHETGSSLGTFTIPGDKELNTRGLIHYNEPHTFIADESVYVWGMQATSTHQIRTADFSSESLNSLEWALIFTLHFED